MSCPRPNTPRSDPKSVAELAEPLRSRIHTAIIDAPTKRLVLVSGYRDPGRQWDLRHARCPGRECDRRCKGYPTTAVPGASNHQKRRAADMGGVDLDWLIAHRARYGLGLTVRGEKWHFEASGVDVPTGRTIGTPTVRIIPFQTRRHPLMALTDAEQEELLALARRIDRGVGAVQDGITLLARQIGYAKTYARRGWAYGRAWAQWSGRGPSVSNTAGQIDEDARLSES